MKFSRSVMTLAFLALPGVGHAQSTSADRDAAVDSPPPALTVSGSVAIASDYRFRGVSQSDEQMAVQGGITIAHDSGFHVGTWASNLSGWGTFGGANMKLDLIGGYKPTLRPSFSKGQDGTGNIAGSTVAASLPAAF